MSLSPLSLIGNERCAFNKGLHTVHKSSWYLEHSKEIIRKKLSWAISGIGGHFFKLRICAYWLILNNMMNNIFFCKALISELKQKSLKKIFQCFFSMWIHSLCSTAMNYIWSDLICYKKHNSISEVFWLYILLKPPFYILIKYGIHFSLISHVTEKFFEWISFPCACQAYSMCR